MKKELQSKDLRIGNLVYIPQTKTIEEIGCLEQNGRFILKDWKSSYSSISCLKPIELTEEICQKHHTFKARRDEAYQHDIFEDEYGFHFVIDTYRDCHEIMRVTKKVDYVHEWQNLYFAITNNELILELTTLNFSYTLL